MLGKSLTILLLHVLPSMFLNNRNTGILLINAFGSFQIKNQWEAIDSRIMMDRKIIKTINTELRSKWDNLVDEDEEFEPQVSTCMYSETSSSASYFQTGLFE